MPVMARSNGAGTARAAAEAGRGLCRQLTGQRWIDERYQLADPGTLDALAILRTYRPAMTFSMPSAS